MKRRAPEFDRFYRVGDRVVRVTLTDAGPAPSGPADSIEREIGHMQAIGERVVAALIEMKVRRLSTGSLSDVPSPSKLTH
jgi:hypothetical protein